MSDEQIFAAVTAELRAAPEAVQREAWKATVAALFAAELEALNITTRSGTDDEAAVSQVERGRVGSVPRIFKEVSVVDGCIYAEWCKHARGICRDLYNSSWSLSTILESRTSKVKWARKPVLNE
ncbi:hypothetical protein CCR75_000056 [Bremia lactucae]|uniref:Uncharacterized protein n=1 Tax=Bremia lactucae TaxID=4779 RepID=A0A976FHU7_BRELC|nr:hypothetical protein CCR75_000056 [Bremia lactucae]